MGNFCLAQSVKPRKVKYVVGKCNKLRSLHLGRVIYLLDKVKAKK